MPYEMNLAKAFENGTYRWEKSEDGSYYVLKDVVFCEKPLEAAVYYAYAGRDVPPPPPGTEPDGLIQSLFIYVPAAIFEGGSINGYDAKTAPIIFQNNCSGWKSSNPSTPANQSLLEHGCVYVSCGARSRLAGIDPKTGLEMGKSPSGAVDQKAGVRFLRANSAVIPGDTEKLISCGGSGAGQMSSILGASGNNPAYYPYLYEIGALGIEKHGDEYVSTIRDDIFASMCYCPITDIANAGPALAWMRLNAGDEFFMTSIADTPEGPQKVVFTPLQLQVQRDIAEAYCNYVNGLELKSESGELLSFDVDENGKVDPRSGSYYRETLKIISDSLNVFIKDALNPDGTFTDMVAPAPFTPEEPVLLPSLDAYLDKYSDKENWLKQREDGTFEVTDLDGFVRGTHMECNKNFPAFDSPAFVIENTAFGDGTVPDAHFSWLTADVMERNYEVYRQMEGFDTLDVDAYISEGKDPFIMEQVYLYASMAQLLEGKTDPAKHWRTRNGAADPHTSFSIAYTLAMAAKKNPKVESVDYGLSWGKGHGMAEGSRSTGNLIDWIDSICK